MATTSAMERRRRSLAKLAFQRLAGGHQLLRREIFEDPDMGQHMNESWETRFLRYLEQNEIIRRYGNRYQIVQTYSEAAVRENATRVLAALLDNEEVLGRLLFSTLDPLLFTKDDPFSTTGVEEAIEETEEEQEPETHPESSPPPATEESPQSGTLLKLIAERLLLVLEALVRMREDSERREKKLDRVERKMDSILKELGVKVDEEGKS